MEVNFSDPEGIARKIIAEDARTINVDTSKLDYTLKNMQTTISYNEAETLLQREDWFRRNYPKMPDNLHYYLARNSLGQPVTDEEIRMEKLKISEKALAELKRERAINKRKEKLKNNEFTIRRGSFTLTW